MEGEAEEREEEDGMDMRVEAGGGRAEKVDGLRGGDDFSGFVRTGRMARADGGGRWGGHHGGNIIVVVGEERDMQGGTCCCLADIELGVYAQTPSQTRIYFVHHI